MAEHLTVGFMAAVMVTVTAMVIDTRVIPLVQKMTGQRATVATMLLIAIGPFVAGYKVSHNQ